MKFDSCNRKPNKTVMEYVAQLRRLAQDCNGSTPQQMLRDRIINDRINDDRTQRRLLSETELTFENALAIAVLHEMATKNAQDLQTSAAAKCFEFNNGLQETHTVKGDSRECYRCSSL